MIVESQLKLKGFSLLLQSRAIKGKLEISYRVKVLVRRKLPKSQIILTMLYSIMMRLSQMETVEPIYKEMQGAKVAQGTFNYGKDRLMSSLVGSKLNKLI